jgi:hypothetical protein
VFGVSIDYLVGREEHAPTADHNVVSEARIDYVAGSGETYTDTGPTSDNAFLAGIQRDLQEIAERDPAALEYIASMVRAIKEKAVRDDQEQPPAARTKKSKS